MSSGEITRYDFDFNYGDPCIAPEEGGEYVKYDDYAKLESLCDDYERLCQSKDAQIKGMESALAKPVAAALPASNEIEKLRELVLSLPCERTVSEFVRGSEGYRQGHQDALHAVTEMLTDFAFDAATPALPVVPEGYAIVPKVMTAAMINAWTGGKSVTSDNVAANTTFQKHWKMVLAAPPELPEGNQQPQDMADRDSALHAEPAGRVRASPLVLSEVEIGGIMRKWQAQSNSRYELCRAVEAEVTARCRAEGGVTSEKPSLAPSHAASTEPVGVVVVFNEGGSGEYRAVAPIGKPNYNLANFLPEGTKLFTATQAAQLTEQDAKDAARYRWLRYADDAQLAIVRSFSVDDELPEGDEFDAAIDAAILANQSQKG